MPDVLHGTVNAYVNHACRCTPCRDAHTTYGRERRRLIAYGRHDPIIDALEVQLHIKQLRADGMTIPHIAKQAGQPVHVLYGIQRGGNTKASRAAAILNVQPIPARVGHHPSTGTLRRIHGLQLQGWTIQHIADAADVHVDSIRHVGERENATVTTKTRDAIIRATRHLAARTPPDTTITRRCITHARNRGYTSLLAWDDIDDPNEQPPTPRPARLDTGTDPELITRVWELHAAGWTDQRIAFKVGYRTASAVCKLRARHPNPKENK